MRAGQRRLLTTKRLLVASGLIALTISTAGPIGVSVAGTQRPTCGGEKVRTVHGKLMKCTFDDEFSAATGDAHALDTTKWAPQVTADSGYTTGHAGAQACYLNSKNNVAVSGGKLRLTVRREAAPLACGTATNQFTTRYTAGMVSTYDSFSQTYGRFEVRARIPSAIVPGLQETFWLWPVNETKYGSWPLSGEIDFAEFYSEFATLDVPYLHYRYKSAHSLFSARLPIDSAQHHSPESNRHLTHKHHTKKVRPHRFGRTGNPATPPLSRTSTAGRNVVTTYSCSIKRAAFNTYAVDWAPGSITIEANGRNCLTDHYRATRLHRPAPFNRPFLIALTQALGSGLNAYLPLITPLPATTQIDYVRAWT